MPRHKEPEVYPRRLDGREYVEQVQLHTPTHYIQFRNATQTTTCLWTEEETPDTQGSTCKLKSNSQTMIV